MQFVAELVFGLLKLLHRLAHSAREFWQLLCAEQNENDQQNDDQVGSGQIHEAGDEAHTSLLRSDSFGQLARQIAQQQPGLKLTDPRPCGKKSCDMRPIWKGSISFGLVYIPVA